eukprot:CAMPEP_0169469784 /NCGR_PEP_ID=MMETSP1042-20121227/23664_1 /TAXON_ID=464988 /ORGANISM="Hemiselmis andersenii, Strain CCMP1180" /LENGTH=157 /DNA_ID=CAMNT_0009583283 /DNA_START=144 /DNA_END=613 /DNA_ORIENTATION=-
MPPPPAAMLHSRPWNSVSNVVSEGDRTTFTWCVGRVKPLSFGDPVYSKPVRAGGSEWKMVYFPKGFTDPDYASVYATSIKCELDEGDPQNPDRITERAFATVKVSMTPQPADFGGAKDRAAPTADEDDDEEDDESVASSAVPPSTVQSASRKSGSKG